MESRITRRHAIGLIGAAGVAGLGTAGTAAQVPDATVRRNDDAVARLLKTQVTDSGSPHRGSVPDPFGLYSAGAAGSVAETLTASFVHPQSRFHRDAALVERIRIAAGFLERAQSPQGNVDLLTTNFNSPPDTGFVVHVVATAAAVARGHGAAEITALLRPFLVRAGAGMAAGGVHTPNHRWVICSALAQIHELFPDDRYTARIDRWLAEGIDIDADGQFTERSTLTYNVVTDRALVVMADKLKQPALLEPVRRNLATLRYLLHADGDVVTEISRRQDQYTRGGLASYWFPLTYLAIADRDGQLATMARAASEGSRLSTLLEYPLLSTPLPAGAALPDDYERLFAEIGIARIRRRDLSATLILGGASRLMTMRSGDAAVEGLRMASAFFGKGQFVPDSGVKDGAGYAFRQALEAPYYQPLTGQTITTNTWSETRSRRTQSEVARLAQLAEIVETPRGFRIRLRAHGTTGVPLAVEIALRDEGELQGCVPVEGSTGSFLLEQGHATYRTARHGIRFGPGLAAHRYTQVRGAEPKLPGRSVYVTAFTPFDHTLTLEALR